MVHTPNSFAPITAVKQTAQQLLDTTTSEVTVQPMEPRERNVKGRVDSRPAIGSDTLWLAHNTQKLCQLSSIPATALTEMFEQWLNSKHKHRNYDFGVAVHTWVNTWSHWTSNPETQKLAEQIYTTPQILENADPDILAKKIGDPELHRNAETIAVRHEANKHLALIWLVANRHPNTSSEDLQSFGYQGLVKALEKYNPEKWEFSTYAIKKINGAILDNTRKEQPVPKRLMQFTQKVNNYIAYYHETHGVEPTTEQICAHLGVSPTRILQTSRAHTPHQVTPQLAAQLPDTDYSIEDRVIANELQTQLLRSILELPETEKSVLLQIHYDNKTLKEIAETENLPKTEIKVLRDRAYRKLAHNLDPYDPTTTPLELVDLHELAELRLTPAKH